MTTQDADGDAGHHDDGASDRHPAIAKLTPKAPLPATGSRLRDHLANERTELAWIRTSVALITLGIAIDKLLITENAEGQVIGLIVLVGGLFAMTYAAVNYILVQKRIERDVYKPNFLGPLLLSAALSVGGIIALIFVL
jgi:putative membrane protein